MLTDTHAHLDSPSLQADLAGVLQRADAAGVKRVITIGTTAASSRRSLAIAEQFPQVFCAVGLHPNNVADEPPGWLDTVRELAASPRVVALGETGLDYHYLPSKRGGSEQEDAAEKAAQKVAFRAQLDLAVELKMPVIIHERNAWEDTLAILGEYTGRIRAVFHCFGRAPECAAQLLKFGHFASFTGIVTFHNGNAAQASARAMPADALFVETDSPYLAPVPHRGKPCEPAFVRHTAEAIATLRGISLEQFASECEEAANLFFRFPQA